MAQHIGIVACSAEGAALCYRTICLEGAELMGKHNHPEVSMHTHPLAEYMKFIYADDWTGVAELMLSSAEKLAKAGADFLICPTTPSTRRSIWWPTARHAPGCISPKKLAEKPDAATTNGSVFWARAT